MPHYKNNAGAVYWFDADAPAEFIPADCVPITDAEADELRAPTPEQLAAADHAAALAELAALDLASIRPIREYLAALPDAPQFLKDREAAAVAARARLKP